MTTRTSGTACLAVLAGLLWAADLRAGLYNTKEVARGPNVTKEGVEALPFKYLRQEILLDLNNVANEQFQTPLRKKYLDQRTELQVKARTGRITTEERVNLSEYLIRLRQFGKAIDLLTPVLAQERSNFMVPANLATACQQDGQLIRAREYLSITKEMMPREWPGLTVEQLKWYRRAEEFQLKLVRLRNQELVGQPSGKAKPPETVDNLFDVAFVGENGHYEAGKIAPDQKAKLPRDAIAIVQQLLVWLPDDTRLYWLLGELMNAEGDVPAAATVFDECVWTRRYDAAALRVHRQIVQAALPTPEVAESVQWAPDRRQLQIVLGLIGLLVAVLAYWQLREFRRRRGSGSLASRS
jgi:hypothetical protein